MADGKERLALLKRLALTVALISLATPAWAGPPYVTDDPEPTDYQHFEIYFFGAGTHTRDGSGGAGGIDFNYGGLPDVQLTATLPVEYDSPNGRPTIGGLGNIELAVKYKFLHQDDVGLDVAVFPRVFLPSASSRVGDSHVSVLLPIWAEHDWDKWSVFGGGGCVFNSEKNFCLEGVALTRQFLPNLQLGVEVYHQGADSVGGEATTGLGFGAKYDLNETLHVIASMGPGLQHAAETNRYSWYAALLWTF